MTETKKKTFFTKYPILSILIVFAFLGSFLKIYAINQFESWNFTTKQVKVQLSEVLSADWVEAIRQTDQVSIFNIPLIKVDTLVKYKIEANQNVKIFSSTARVRSFLPFVWANSSLSSISWSKYGLAYTQLNVYSILFMWSKEFDVFVK